MDDSSHLLGDHIFNNHTISIKRSNTPAKLITFLCVPPSIDDDELIHLVQYFGTISHTKITHNCHKDPLSKGLPNSNRSIELELYTDIEMPTYFWLDGYQSSPNPVQISVKHTNQSPQYYHCLHIGSECQAAGNGRMCNSKNFPQ